MHIFGAATAPDEERVGLDPAKDDPLVDMAIKAGFKMKPPNTSIAVIRPETETVFRVLCFESGEPHQFDVFGVLKASQDNAGEECTVVQRILEHFEKCCLKSKPTQTFIIQHNATGIYKLTVTWAGGE